MRERRKPESARRVTRYEEFVRYVDAWANGHLNLLLIVGEPGLAKSRVVRAFSGEETCWIEGTASGFGMFRRLYEYTVECKAYGWQAPRVVINDVDSLYTDRGGVRLLKSLCETEPVKRIMWHTDAKTLDRQRIPREFGLRAGIAIVANDWNTVNANVAAIEDRAHVVSFEPTAEEVHLRVAEWFRDQEIFDWFAEHLHLIRNPSMRHYVRAAESKQGKLEWRQDLLARWGLDETTVIVAKLLEDASFQSERARVDAFVARTGMAPATFYNRLKKLRKRVEMKRIILKSDKTAEDMQRDSEELLDLLRRRVKHLGNG